MTGQADNPGDSAGSDARARRAAMAALACMVAVYFFSFFQRVAVPGTIFDELQSEFNASAKAITLLGALYLYIYGGMQVFAGMLSDRFGGPRVLLVGGCLLAVGSILFPFGPALPHLYAARVLVGLGASLVFLSVVKAIDTLFGPEHFAQLLGVSLFLGYAGGLTGTFPFERAVNAVGWRSALLGAGGLCALAVAAAAWLLWRTGRLQHRGTHGQSLALLTILRNRDSWPVLFVGAANFSFYFLIQATLGKKFLLDHAGLSSPAAASFTFVMMLVTMFVALASGFLSRLMGNRRKPMTVLSVAFNLASVLVLLISLRAGLAAGWFLVGYTLLALSCFASPMTCALIKELNPPATAGTSVGLLNGFAYLAVAGVNNVAGAVLDHSQGQAVRRGSALVYPAAAYQTMFLLSLGLVVVCLIVSLWIRETHGRNVFGRTPR